MSRHLASERARQREGKTSARQGASVVTLAEYMRSSDLGPAMGLVENRGGRCEARMTTNVAVVRQAGARLVVAVAGLSGESRNRNRGGVRRRRREHCHCGGRHIPKRAMVAPTHPAQRLTPNDHHHYHRYHDDQRHRHPAHFAHTTATHSHKFDLNGPWPYDPVTPSRNAKLLLAFVICLLVGIAPIATEAVDCFKCSSRNGSNPACEDPFHNLNTTRVNSPILPDPQPSVIYHTPCYAGKKGREGLFPASACIKLTGVFDTTGETLVVRHCALDSGTLTQDTELGCVLACPEDACNSARGSVLINLAGIQHWLIVLFALVILVSNLQR